ncbi:hypothetical protein FHW15_000311 [Terracoccus luteus]|uniref:Spermatogenesis-associated protein 20-like TRX domain-containing protein n=2 Tax=Terracoccus luteus TaxID=53356 RepID=A0A839PT44_9MICO|nr:hypothetical protein [Terracoccus luteus]MCP2170827.1 hypothetical protein [Terracoccus luteus]
MNRLADATSPYLLQHRDNPVDWQEWGEEAFAEARARNVPVLLSVGYAACHWCHVMAHESFEDDTVAAAVNERFVAVKVDREERPDIDAVYMSAVAATTGHGGWPMTVFLTPEGDPFFCGTYFPRDHFLRVLAALDEAWRTQEQQVRASGAHVAGTLGDLLRPEAPGQVDAGSLDEAVEELSRTFDADAGGFGGAPKFPPSMVLEFLLRQHARTGHDLSLRMADRTLTAMARSGTYDQLGGGFARYAVDARWVVPHFEKMLYDNAQLLRVYAHWWRLTRNPLAQRVVRETAEFLLTALRTDEGGFASSLDADTEGVEGLTYVWTPDGLVEVLGDEDGRHAAELFGVTDEGTFEHGRSTLQLQADPDDTPWFADVRARLATHRATRPQPGRDDKVVTAWNGLAVAALADAGALLDEPEWVRQARRCAEFVLDTHVVDGRLRRASRDGRVGAALAVADDHGDLAEGLLALHQATGEARWLDAARGLLDDATQRFAADDGGFHDSGSDAEQLYLRPRSASDNAEPSGQAALAGALVTLGALTGSAAAIEAGRRATEAGLGLATREPRFGGWTLAVAEALVAGPLQVAIVAAPAPEIGSDTSPLNSSSSGTRTSAITSAGTSVNAERLLAVARSSSSPGLVLVHGEPDSPGIPLLEGRPLVDGEPAAYVCRGFVCDRPVTDPAELAAALATPLATPPASAPADAGAATLSEG